ncbi:hypothetical protein NQ315_015974 [Exocentrus adspersus]|uniref:Uncharacterized protein n=1 Tax=Exocentrus adspersus TaxID=1586481 RepID=A0AAV8VK78_9CUCU|nr:hypothetical protein NQ315_015974 [Exocentrus adspersus]
MESEAIKVKEKYIKRHKSVFVLSELFLRKREKLYFYWVSRAQGTDDHTDDEMNQSKLHFSSMRIARLYSCETDLCEICILTSIEKLRTPVLLNNSPIIRLSNIHEQCQD